MTTPSLYALQYFLSSPRGMWKTIKVFETQEAAQAECDRSSSVVHRRVAQVSPDYEAVELRAMYPQYYL